jgi:hypothetical protein
MTVQELAEACRNISEDSIKKLKIESWISMELGRIVNRKHYFWRRAAIEFDTVAQQPTYDLTAGPNAIAADFMQMGSNLFQFDGTNKTGELQFVDDNLGLLKMRKGTTVTTPSVFSIELGSNTKTLRLSPIPDTVYSYAGVYYRGAVINWNSPDDEEIPLVPPEMHYVVYQAMERRVFFYLYGQKDPRAAIAVQAEQQCLGDLDAYKSGSTMQALEWRSGDHNDFVQSTR